MLNKHVILLETEPNIWVAYSVSNTEAKKMSMAHLPHLHYYVFECNLLQQFPYTMKLKYPLNQYFRSGEIILYREEQFEGKEQYLTVRYDDPDQDTHLEVLLSLIAAE
jgi:hypothetical protein